MRPSALLLALFLLPASLPAEEDPYPWNAREHTLKFKLFTEKGSPSREEWEELAPAERRQELAQAQAPAKARFEEVRAYYAEMTRKWNSSDLQSRLYSYGRADSAALALWLGEEHERYVQGKITALRRGVDKARSVGLEDADMLSLGRYLTPAALGEMRNSRELLQAMQRSKQKKSGQEMQASASGARLKKLAGTTPSAISAGKLSGMYDGSQAGRGEAPAPSAARIGSGGKIAAAVPRISYADTIKHGAPGMLAGGQPRQPQPPPAKHVVPPESERGPASYAKTWWKDLEKEQEGKTGFAAGFKRYTAKAARGLISLSSLADVETSYQTMKVDYKNGASAGTLVKDGAVLLKDGALAAVTFIPAANMLKSVKAGEGAIKVAKAGTAIPGMVKAEAATAKAVAGELNAVIKASANADDVVRGATEVAKRYGVEVAQGGRIGESVGTASKVVYNGAAGKAHEVVHVVQQVQTRATLGTAAEGSISAFEKVAYAQHEMFAKEATRLLGTESANYMSALSKNVGAFEKALASGAVPEANVALGSRIYGHIPGLLGTSQLQIASNLAVSGKGFVQGTNHAIQTYVFGAEE